MLVTWSAVLCAPNALFVAVRFTVQYVMSVGLGCVSCEVCPPQHFQGGQKEHESLGCDGRW